MSALRADDSPLVGREKNADSGESEGDGGNGKRCGRAGLLLSEDSLVDATDFGIIASSHSPQDYWFGCKAPWCVQIYMHSLGLSIYSPSRSTSTMMKRVL